MPLTDAPSQQWLVALRSQGAPREAAIRELHGLLLRAARSESIRRAASSMPAKDREDLSLQAADDALMLILSKLDTFQGRSRFTTWAYKFALFEVASKMRKHAWHNREVALPDGSWSLFLDLSLSPEAAAEEHELLRALEEGIGSALTTHQRNVLVALTITGVPVDVLAERLSTNRGALYKTLHDARRKLREHLEAQDLTVPAQPRRRHLS